MLTLSDAFLTEKNKLYSGIPIVSLVRIYKDSTYTSYTDINENVVFDSVSYTKATYSFGANTLATGGDASDIEFNIAYDDDLLDLIKAGLVGGFIDIKITTKAVIDASGSTTIMDKTYRVKKVTYNDDTATLTIGRYINKNKFPKNQALKTCDFDFFGKRCGIWTVSSADNAFAGINQNWAAWDHYNNLTYWSSDGQSSTSTMGKVYTGVAAANTANIYGGSITEAGSVTYKMTIWLKASENITLSTFMMYAGFFGSANMSDKEITTTWKRFEGTLTVSAGTYTLGWSLYHPSLAGKTIYAAFPIARDPNLYKTCNRTLAQCTAYNNETKFGGFTGILDDYSNF